MSIRRIAAVQMGFLLAAMFANAASQKDTVRITVLDSVTRASTLTAIMACRRIANNSLTTPIAVRQQTLR